ncbi:hypothetical protein NA57DRAFT_42172 [Rhizodiscina lignyota]|uniref:RING-type E3 ubiquitin transferase n=1 Tax=Rhizodiscina lignyota TaxID=1504668 RepID=A0A9P4M8D3_9PEZI|nr:hypothetical protein NA57DRAFT_42172 [Rhizodiscina lignyota]
MSSSSPSSPQPSKSKQKRPATAPATPIPPLHHDEDGVQDACVICLQPITERAITVPCNHYTFDFICLASWLNERPKCPLCNVDVTEVQYDWVSPNDFKRYRVPPPSPSSSQSTEATGRFANLPTRGRSRYADIRRARRRPPPPPPAPTEDVAILQRRHVYRQHLYSLHVGSNRVSRYRNITPHLFATSPELQTRARTWMRRELRVFSYLYPASASSDVGSPSSSGRTRRANNAEFLLEYIIAILKTVDIKGSGGQAEDMLAEFLGREDARLFLHELAAWLRSPYANVGDWDRNVQYRGELPTEFGRDGRPVGRKERDGRRLGERRGRASYERR